MYEFDRSTPVTVALRVHGGQVDVVAEERLSVQVDVTSMDNNDKGREAAENTRVVLEDDTLLIQVDQAGAACHEGYKSCFFRSIEGDGGTFKTTEPLLKPPGDIYKKK